MLFEFLEILNFAYFFASLVDHLRVSVLNRLKVDISLELIGENEVIADPILLKLIEDHRKHYNRLVIFALPR